MGAYSIDEIINALKKMKSDIPSIEKQVAKKVASIVAKEFRKIFDESIESYYSSYSPKYYSRTWSMANAYKIKADGEYITLHSDSSLIDDTHRVSPEYIFEHMFFKEGYHGGANNGPDHPSPGTFLYRSPVPGFGETPYTRWSGAAIKTQSVIDIADPKINEYLNSTSYEDMCAEIFKSIILQYI